MSEITLHFDMLIRVEDINNIDDLGKELATFLQESLFNGEDVLDVKYINHDIIV